MSRSVLTVPFVPGCHLYTADGFMTRTTVEVVDVEETDPKKKVPSGQISPATTDLDEELKQSSVKAGRFVLIVRTFYAHDYFRKRMWNKQKEGSIASILSVRRIRSMVFCGYNLFCIVNVHEE